MADQRVEEIAPRHRRRPLGDLPQHLLGQVEILVGLHVLQRERHLVRRLLEEGGVRLRVLTGIGAGHRQGPDALPPHDQRNDDERPDAVRVGELLGGIGALGVEITAQQELLVLEYPSHVALVGRQ